MIKPASRSKSRSSAPQGTGNLSDVPLDQPIQSLSKLMRDGSDFAELAAFVRNHDPAWISNEEVPNPIAVTVHLLPPCKR